MRLTSSGRAPGLLRGPLGLRQCLLASAHSEVKRAELNTGHAQHPGCPCRHGPRPACEPVSLSALVAGVQYQTCFPFC